jgi:hypothetical protein
MPAGTTDFYFSQKRADGRWRPTKLLFSGYLEYFAGVKGERE